MASKALSKETMVDTRKISKTLSYWLRHKPKAGGLELDKTGWARIDEVLAALARAGLSDRAEDLQRTVAESDKNRFELSEDGRSIRARQGHSLAVDLEWPAADPPDWLFHGTVERFLDLIFAEGLKPMARHHVHLSPDVATASAVGARRGKAVILKIAAGRMASDGHVFRLSGNQVWLAERVPPEYLERA
jgi:putative RNA 2'-phosphotransferase